MPSQTQSDIIATLSSCALSDIDAVLTPGECNVMLAFVDDAARNLSDLEALRAELAELRVPDDVAKDAEVGAAIQRACGELPEGFTIHIDLENNAGSVEMMWEDERWEPDFDLSFAGQINECVDEAIRSTDEDAAILAAKENKT